MAGIALGSVDRNSPRPVYQQMADQIRTAIDTGQVQPGDQLPSEAELIAHYGVAIGTVRNALTVLLQRGLVDIQRGRGVFVADRTHLLELLEEAEAYADGGPAVSRLTVAALAAELRHHLGLPPVQTRHGASR